MLSWFKIPGVIDFGLMLPDDFQDWIAGYKNMIPGYAFPQQILPAALGVRHQHIAGMINDATVGLFRDTIIEAAVTSLHMIYGDAQTFCYNSRQRAVCISEHQKLVRLFGQQDFLDLIEDDPYLFAECTFPG